MGGALRGVSKGRAGGGGGDALQVDVVLDREGDAVEGQVPRVRSRQPLQVGGLLGLGQDMDPDRVIGVPAELPADLGHQTGRGQVPGKIASTQVTHGEVQSLGRHDAGRSEGC